MAKVQVLAAIPDDMVWYEEYFTAFRVNDASKKAVEYLNNEDSDLRFTITGKNLKLDEDGDLIGGTVTGVKFTYDGELYVKISDLNSSAKSGYSDVTMRGTSILGEVFGKSDVMVGSGDTDHIIGGAGNDKIDGKSGDDFIYAQLGNDKLTGGKGSDVFNYDGGDRGRDTITDFDADGGAGNQDFLDIGGIEFDVAKSGKNTLISFGNQEILLLGVKPGEIDGSDFVF